MPLEYSIEKKPTRRREVVLSGVLCPSRPWGGGGGGGDVDCGPVCWVQAGATTYIIASDRREIRSRRITVGLASARPKYFNFFHADL